ncbi:unnamed protein product [Schistocephalus solidus]|uniref:C2H2-type domain-containing protein n=1 Tax=Schistocephalus solidus TaxID=70667 RepID=A0A183STA8_SCHSO|nr:unnamed protein product [Schistocephalus solidus]
MTLEGHFEEISEATANKPDDLGGSCPGQPCMEKIGKDWGSNIRSQPDRRCQGEKGGSCPATHDHLSLQLPAPITATTTTCPTPTTSVATSDYLPPAISNTTAAPSTSDGDSVLTCPHCDRTFTSHIGLVGHLRINRTETGETVLGSPTCTRRTRFNCSHCPRTFTHHMGLLGHMGLHENLR